MQTTHRAFASARKIIPTASLGRMTVDVRGETILGRQYLVNNLLTARYRGVLMATSVHVD